MFLKQLIIVAAFSVGVTKTDFVFEVQLHSYQNPTQYSRANLGCCDRDSDNTECRSSCDTYLYICLTLATNTQVSVPGVPEECPFGFLETDLLTRRNGDSVIFSDGDTLDISGNTNPANFFSYGPWPGSIQLVLQSFDRDGGNDDFIDIEFVNITDIEIGATNFTLKRNYIGTFQLSHYVLSFRAHCADNYYGSDCNIFCMARNDSLGHYYCNEDGSIMCLMGYTNSSSNCTQCLPSKGCLGGYCTKPYECLCLEGYSGENCSVIMITDEANTGALVAGSTVGVVTFLLLSLVIALLVVMVYNKRKHSISTMTDGRTQGFQENATYMDFIQHDSLNRSVELVISSPMSTSHYQLDQPPRGHIKNLGTVPASHHDAVYEDPQYIQMNGNEQHIINPHFSYSENSLALSDADSSTSLQRSQGQNVSTIQQNGKSEGLDKSKTDFLTEDIPMKRNNSYSMLDTEAVAVGTEGAVDNVYSYPKVKSKVKQIQDNGYSTVNTKLDNATTGYSKIELSNMYENITGDDDNMTDNQFYGISAQSEETHVTGLFDPYVNDDDFTRTT